MSVQFVARCVDLRAHNIQETFLRADSSIDCESAEHQRFRLTIVPLIVVYQFIPVIYYAMLMQIKDRIKDTPGKNVGMLTAKSDLALMPLASCTAATAPTFGTLSSLTHIGASVSSASSRFRHFGPPR